MALSERQATRGTTPFAYATPYSNAPVQEVPVIRHGSIARTAAAEDEGPVHGVDELYNIEIYESGSDESYQNDGSGSHDSAEMVALDQPTRAVRSSQPGQYLPEDEPWPGIEDQENVSDGENIDPNQAGQTERRSQGSSQPSEYPSTRSMWPEEGARFHIHEDAEEDAEEDDGQRM